MSNTSNLYIKQMEVGPMENYAYFIGDKTTKEVAVVDPSWDADLLQSAAEAEGLTIKAAFLTHGHFDHANALGDLLSKYDIPVYVSAHEKGSFSVNSKNVKRIKPNEKIKIGSIEIECIHTPGHTPGGQCLLVGGNLITGDTLFVDGCGRCDLPGSDVKKMYDSLCNKIMKLPDSTVIYPGHNYGPKPSDTLANQKQTNHYLKCNSLQEFMSERMGF